jgi:hypothetical protein
MSDIAELFARDPNQCSDADIKAIIEDFRAKRAQFNLGNMMAGSTKPKASKAKEPSVKLDLGDLGL